MSVFNAQAKIFLDILGEDGSDGKQSLEICQYVSRCTLDIICGKDNSMYNELIKYTEISQRKCGNYFPTAVN